MKSRKGVIWYFVFLVAIVPVLIFGTIQGFEKNFQRLPFPGHEKHTVGTFHFQDQNGNTWSKVEWRNKIVVANFFFTSCPAVCPRMMYQLKRVQAYSNPQIQIISFTVDPQRDSVGRLRAYAERMGIKSNWHLLTGKKMELYRFARKELGIDATDGEGGPEDFIHSDNLVLVDPEQRIRGYYKGTDETDVNRLIHDIEKLKTESNL